jgi:DNA helicase-2/ATP-dependent DNA helicase PcrA
MSRRYTLRTPSNPLKIDYPSELNEQQLAAVSAPPGASLVIAGAGSGKTRTLTYRVAWLLEHGAPPSSILLLTFTNKAAREMLDRVAHLLPQSAAGIWGGTFHSVGNRILRAHADAIGFRSGFSIMDRDDQEDLIEAVVARAGLRSGDQRFPKAGVLAELFSLSVNTGRSMSELVATRYRYFYPLIEKIEQVQIAYEGRKREANCMDFDDLIAKVFDLFATHPDILQIYRKQFSHVLVDEYQDTNRLQAGLIDLLGGEESDLMVVGDDAQSIYSWRGADCSNIIEFPKRYPKARVYKIETNYRSVPGVLELANAAIEANRNQFSKQLRAVRNAGPSLPAMVPLGTNNQQAAFVAQRIRDLHEEEGIPWREIAVLYRAHFHSMEVQFELTRQKIPFQVTSGLRFFEQAHIKDVSAFLKLAVNPRDELAFKRMVRLLPGIGNRSAEKMWMQAKEVLAGEPRFDRLLGSVVVPKKSGDSWKQLVHTLEELVAGEQLISTSAMIQSVVLGVYDEYMQNKFPNYEARKEDLQTLANYADTFDNPEEFLSQLALLNTTETSEAVATDGPEDAVCLSSVHQAKGLEWKAVFVIWLADGLFPTARSLESDESLEEERRLFYVAVTRCKDDLYLTYPEMRVGSSFADGMQRPSRFLREIPEHLVEDWNIESELPSTGEFSDWESNTEENDNPF